jgi:2-phosphoglycerate kinase
MRRDLGQFRLFFRRPHVVRFHIVQIQARIAEMICAQDEDTYRLRLFRRLNSRAKERRENEKNKYLFWFHGIISTRPFWS